MQVADFVNNLEPEGILELTQLLGDLSQQFSDDVDAYAQTGISDAIVKHDLDAIAKYIVHLNEDQVHKIAI